MRTFFEWDPVKASINLRKHGVSFETALRVFADPLICSEPEDADSYEQRWQSLGKADSNLLLVVIHTTTEVQQDELVEVIRIISARQPDPKERRRYEQQNGEN